MSRIIRLTALAAVVLGLAAPAHAASPDLTWSGASRAPLGGLLRNAVTTSCATHVVVTGGVVLDDLGGRAARISEIHTAKRGVRGPFGVRVGMSERALRAALGRRSVAFTVHGRRGRLLVGPHGHTLWALDKSARARTVGEFGVAINKTVALRAAKAGACAPVPAELGPTNTNPIVPAADPGTSAPVPQPTDASPTTTTTAPPPQCPATLPQVGPYMRVACDDSTGNQIQYTCHPDWRDPDQDPADGCESEKDGLQTMWFTNSSSQALADHILGIYAMDGYGVPIDPATNGPPPGWSEPGWGSYSDQNISSVPVTVAPNCASDPAIDCPGGQPAEHPSGLNLDLTQYAGDTQRTYVSMTGTVSATGSEFSGAGAGTTQATASARFRLKTTAPIQVTRSGATCNVTIDTRPGSFPDVTFGATLAKATDPDTGQGDDGPPQVSGVTISNLENTDYAISPATSSDFLCYGSTFITLQDVVATIQPALTEWFKARTRLCGTAGPYWWESCPASVDVSW